MADRRVTTLVGRGSQLRELHAGLDDAVAGRGRLFLLSGEPGIGKTRLAEEAGHLAAKAGATVVWGRCWESGGAPAYWPWIEVQRALVTWVRDVDAPHLRGALDSLPDLAVRTAAGDLPDPDASRFALFDAVASFLRAVADLRPVVVVLDDLHAADEPSLLLLQFVARQLPGARLMLIGTYRELEARRLPRMYSLLAAIGRDGTTLGLPTLGESEVAELISARSGASPDRLVGAVHSATGGNPLFVNEVIGLLERDGRLGAKWEPGTALGIPEGVRQAIRRRLETVSEDVRRTLALASVIGKEFGAAPLTRVVGLPPARVVEVLDEAASTGLTTVSETGYAFSHALVRETLYDDLGAGPRSVIHRQVAEALEDLHGGDLDAHAAEIAHHFLAAVGLGVEDQGAHYSALAGDAAMQRLAYEDAAAHYDAALAYTPPERRADLLLRSATANLRAGRSEAALSRAGEALGSADAAADERARAVLLWIKAHALAGADTGARLGIVERALAHPDDPGPVLRARLLASLAEELTHAMRLGLPEPNPYERASAALAEATALAESAVDAGVGDTALLAEVTERQLLLLPEHDQSGQRVALAAKVNQLADEIGEAPQHVRAGTFRLLLCLEEGNVAAADAIIDELERLARASRQPQLLAKVLEQRAMRALMEGRLGDCEALCAEAVRRGGALWALRVLSLEFLLRREQDRVVELEAELRRRMGEIRQLVLRADLGLLLADTGREPEAARLLWELLADPLVALQRERPHPWTATIATLADLAVELADRRAAERLSALLEPLAGRVVVYGALYCLAPVTYYLGRLALVVGDAGRAVTHLDAAVTQASGMSAAVWHAHAQAAMAQALIQRGRAGDARTAATLRDEAQATADELGLLRLARQLAPSAVRTSASGVFRREGQVWHATYAGATVALAHTKGMQYLAWLLAAPRRELPAVELATADAPSPARRALTAQDTEVPALDARAKAAYKRRLDNLRAELARAERTGDAAAGRSAQSEIDALARELAGAVGLGGRDRVSGSAERARQAVTKALKSAIDRIAEQHPPLGEHLRATIRTGALCSYNPDARTEVSWET